MTFVFAAIYFGPHLSQALFAQCGIQIFPLILIAIAAIAAYVAVGGRYGSTKMAVSIRSFG